MRVRLGPVAEFSAHTWQALKLKTVSTGADRARLAAAGPAGRRGAGGVLPAVFRLPLAQWGGLIAGLVLAVVVFLTSESGKRLLAFGRDAWREMKKVVWPTRKEALQTTAFVFAARGRHGAVPVADRQGPGMGTVRPDSGLETLMSDAVNPGRVGAVDHPDLKWNVVHAYSGMEKAVERNIQGA